MNILDRETQVSSPSLYIAYYSRGIDMGERDPPDLLTGIIKGINPRVHQEDIIGSLTGSRISSKHGSIIFCLQPFSGYWIWLTVERLIGSTRLLLVCSISSRCCFPREQSQPPLMSWFSSDVFIWILFFNHDLWLQYQRIPWDHNSNSH